MSEDHVTERAKERLGRTLRQKWRLESLLGVGGMAAVYGATHRNGKRVAVKVLHADVAMNPELRSRFLREGYVANAVDHPGAVSVIDDDVDEDGTVYLVMELLEGETLESRWERKKRRLDPQEVLSITDKLLDVLGAAHGKGIIHWFVKTPNPPSTRWVHGDTTSGDPALFFYTFNTPLTVPEQDQCGKVLFSDFHVAGSSSGSNFPTECSGNSFTNQQKALEFMLFDLSSCIQKEDDPPKPPPPQ